MIRYSPLLPRKRRVSFAEINENVIDDACGHLGSLEQLVNRVSRILAQLHKAAAPLPFLIQHVECRAGRLADEHGPRIHPTRQVKVRLRRLGTLASLLAKVPRPPSKIDLLDFGSVCSR